MDNSPWLLHSFAEARALLQQIEGSTPRDSQVHSSLSLQIAGNRRPERASARPAPVLGIEAYFRQQQHPAILHSAGCCLSCAFDHPPLSPPPHSISHAFDELPPLVSSNPVCDCPLNPHQWPTWTLTLRAATRSRVP